MSSGGTEGVAGALNGVGSGIATGFAIGGPVGAAVGGVVGAVSGILGFSSSKKKRKAAKLLRQAKQLQNIQLRREAIVQYQQARAMADTGLAATGASGSRSSAVKGVQQSLYTQVQSNLKMNTEVFNRGVSADKKLNEASSLNAINSMLLSTTSAITVAGGWDDIKKAFKL